MSVRLKVAKAYALVLEAENLVSEAVMADDRLHGEPTANDLNDAWNKLNRAAYYLRWAMQDRDQ